MSGPDAPRKGRVRIARDAATIESVPPELAAEAMSFFPDAVGDGSVFMPTKPLVGKCRLCGEMRRLTKEHIPPASADNRGRLLEHSLEEWFRRTDEEIPGGRLRQGGMWGYTLCARCNNLTGTRYVPEYGRWVASAIHALARASVNVREVDRMASPVRGELGLGGQPSPRPGAFVREVLAMMCSLSGPYDLAGRYPVIRRIVLEGASEGLPEGMSLGLSLVLPTQTRLVGPTAVVDTASLSWEWVLEMAHPPLALLMVIATSRPRRHLFDLSRFTLAPPDEEIPVEARIEMGFAHTIYPGDYRTAATLEAARVDDRLAD